MIWSSYTRIIASICTIALAGFSFAAEAKSETATASPAASPAPAAEVAPAATPAATAPAASPAANNQSATPAYMDSEVVAPRGSSFTLEEMIQAKLDSLEKTIKNYSGPKLNSDSLGKVKADSVRKLIQGGKYVQRARYDKSNFDSWKVDTVLQKNLKNSLFGAWRTPIVSHGHAFRDAELRFDMNDTLYGTTRTYSDSGRYQMTGEYTFKARYRFDNDTTLVSREVFAERQVIRWDFSEFKVGGDSLIYNLKKLEFRDLNDNWLNALQGFNNVPPEIYFRDEKGTAEMKKALDARLRKKK